MKQEYYEVKPNKHNIKHNKVFIFFAFVSVVIIIIIHRAWLALIIPFLFLLFSMMIDKSNHILYNDQEVILFSPLGKAYHYTWDRIKSVNVTFEKVRGRSSINPRWLLKVTYYYSTEKESKTETLQMLYYDYDGAYEFVEFYKKIKETKQ